MYQILTAAKYTITFTHVKYWRFVLTWCQRWFHWWICFFSKRIHTCSERDTHQTRRWHPALRTYACKRKLKENILTDVFWFLLTPLSPSPVHPLPPWPLLLLLLAPLPPPDDVRCCNVLLWPHSVRACNKHKINSRVAPEFSVLEHNSAASFICLAIRNISIHDQIQVLGLSAHIKSLKCSKFRRY